MLSKKMIFTALVGILTTSSNFAIATDVAVGKIDAQFSVNKITGAATYSIPIKVPVGIGGLQPKLSLDYNSQSGQGLSGLGWSLSGATSTIMKCSQNYAQEGVVQSANIGAAIEKLCLDGQKLVNTNGLYGQVHTEYQTEIESDLYVKQNAYPGRRPLFLTTRPEIDFTVSTKSGLIRQYGFAAYMNGPSSLDYVINLPNWISAWALTTTTDVFGNKVKHSYLPQSDSVTRLPDGSSVISDVFHPMALDYSFLKSTNVPKISVYIEYEARPDLKFVNVVGMISAVNKRIKSITVYRTHWDQSSYNTATTNATRAGLYNNSATAVKRYKLTYNENITDDNRSVLTSVEECGFHNGIETCLPKLIFSYANPVSKVSLAGVNTPAFPRNTTPNQSGGIKGLGYDFNKLNSDYLKINTVDFNGDGIADIYNFDPLDPNKHKVWMGSVGGNFSPVAGIPAVGFNDSVNPRYPQDYVNKTRRRKFGDFDGDGKTDILYLVGCGTTNATENRLWLSSNNKLPTDNNWVTTNAYIYITCHWEEAGQTDLSRPVLADFNGDGLTDIYWIALPYGRGEDGFPARRAGAYRDDNDRLYLSHGDGQFTMALGLNFNDYDSFPDVYTEEVFDNFGNGYVVGRWVATYLNYNELKRLNFGDFNGDGLTDIYVLKGSNSTEKDIVYLAKLSSRYDISFELADPTNSKGLSTKVDAITGEFKNKHIKFGDFNNDGITDVYLVYSGNETSSLPVQKCIVIGGVVSCRAYEDKIILFGSNGLITGKELQGAPYNFSGKAIDNLYFADLNGDGLLDIVSNAIENARNLCTSTVTSKIKIYYRNPDWTLANKATENLIDVQKWVTPAYDSNGNLTQRCGSDVPFAKLYESTIDNRMHIADFTGDGIADIYYAKGFSDEPALLLSYQTKTKLLESVSSNLGETLSIQYKSMHDNTVYTDTRTASSQCTYPMFCVKSGPMSLVATTITDQGVHGRHEVNYQYEQMSIHIQGRGNLGFNKVVTRYRDVFRNQIIDKQISIDYSRKLVDIGSGSNSIRAVPLGVGVVKQSSISISRNNKLIPTKTGFSDVNYYVHTNLSGQLTVRPYSELNGTSSYSMLGQPLASADTRTELDRFGNTSLIIKRAIRADNSVAQSTLIESKYGDTEVHKRLGRLSGALITKFKNRSITSLADISERDVNGRIADTTNIEQRITSFKYDSNNILWISEEQESGDPEYLKTTYLYDEYGNKKKATIGVPTSAKYYFAEREATSNTDYSGLVASGNDYILTTYNELAHKQTDIIDIVWGVRSSTGPNGITTQLKQDAFGKKTKEIRADGTETTWIYDWCTNVSHCLPDKAAYFVHETSHITGSPASYTDPPVTVYYDILDRVIQTKTIGFNGDTLYTDTLYDQTGRVWRVSHLYSAGAAKQWTTSYFDELDRVIRVENPDGSLIRNEFNQNDGLETTVTRENIGPDGVSVAASTQRINALGQTEWSKDELGNFTRFSYTAFGSTKTVSGPQGNITLYYDKRGRKLRTDDPNMGAWYYEYDALGNLRKQTDAIGNVVTMQYDALNRMIKKIDIPNTPTLNDDGYEFHWCYDEINTATCAAAIRNQTTTKSIGKLVLTSKAKYRASTSTAYTAANEYFRETYDYDSLGRPITSATLIENTAPAHVTTTFYDNIFPRVDRVEYPAVLDNGISKRFSKVNAYKTYGYLEKIFDADEPSVPLWRAIDANDKNQITKEALGNGVVTHREFDQATGFILSISSGKPGSQRKAVQDLTYQFDSIGNLVRRTNKNIAINSASSVTESFQYDSANRLTDILENGITSKQFAYDALGNITFNSDVGNYHYDNKDKPHRLTRIDPITVSASSVVAGDANADKRIDGLDSSAVSRQLLGLQANNPLGKADCNVPAGVSIADVACIANKISYSTTGSTVYRYDANGNIIGEQSGRRSITYTSFNKPKQIKQAGETLKFDYGPSRARYKQTLSGSEDQTIYYLNGIEYIDDRKKGERRYKLYINAGSRLVAIKTYSSKKVVNTKFVHRDHMGSIDTLTDEFGTVLERIAYDAFGKVRPLVKQVDNDGNITTFNLTKDKSFRGFTGHEHLVSVGLIHMNGRVYDPNIGRFLSADPFVQYPQDTQSYNRYAYVLNNPLSYTDPSGYFHKSVVGELGRFMGRVGKTMGRGVAYMVVFVGGCASGGPACVATGAAAVAVYAGARTAMAGGNIGDVISAAGMAYAMAYLMGSESFSFFEKAVIGGLMGGIQSKENGNSFATGFSDSMIMTFIMASDEDLASLSGEGDVGTEIGGGGRTVGEAEGSPRVSPTLGDQAVASAMGVPESTEVELVVAISEEEAQALKKALKRFNTKKKYFINNSKEYVNKDGSLVDKLKGNVTKGGSKDITKSSRKRVKRLIKNLSDNSRQNNGLSQDKTDQLRRIVEKAGGKLRNDGATGVKGSPAGKPHVQTEGLGKSIDSRHIWTRVGVQ